MDFKNAKLRTKEHISKYGDRYLAFTSGILFAGFSYAIMKKNPELLGGLGSKLLGGLGGRGSAVVDNTTRSFSMNLLTRDSGNQVTNNNSFTTIHIGDRGNTGFVTRCLETGEVFQTQKAAARTYGIPESILSSHLNGRIELQSGLHFERVVAN